MVSVSPPLEQPSFLFLDYHRMALLDCASGFLNGLGLLSDSLELGSDSTKVEGLVGMVKLTTLTLLPFFALDRLASFLALERVITKAQQGILSE